MTIIFTLCLLIGQLIFTTGLYLLDSRLMIFGRFIYGLGGESIAITILTILSTWYLGKDIGFAQV